MLLNDNNPVKAWMVAAPHCEETRCQCIISSQHIFFILNDDFIELILGSPVGRTASLAGEIGESKAEVTKLLPANKTVAVEIYGTN